MLEQLRTIVKLCLIHLKNNGISNLDESIFAGSPENIDNSLTALGLGKVFIYFIKQVTINQLRTLEEVISLALYPSIRERLDEHNETLQNNMSKVWHRMFKPLMNFQDIGSLVAINKDFQLYISRNFFNMRNYSKIVDLTNESDSGPMTLEYTGEFSTFGQIFKDIYTEGNVRDIFWIYDKIQKKIEGKLTQEDYE